MTMTLAEKSVAILAANGFDENHMSALQRVMTKAKAPYKVIAPEQGLVNGWQDKGWGHYFTVDASISTAMGSDFDALVLLGGERGVAKLKTNPHTRRIINHFLDADKPVAAIGAGVDLLTVSPASAGRTVSSLATSENDLKHAKIQRVEAPQTLDGQLLTADGTDIDAWVEAALTLFTEAVPLSDELEAA